MTDNCLTNSCCQIWLLESTHFLLSFYIFIYYMNKQNGTFPWLNWLKGKMGHNLHTLYNQVLWWKKEKKKVICIKYHLKQFFSCCPPKFLCWCTCPWRQHSSRQLQHWIKDRWGFLLPRYVNFILMKILKYMSGNVWLVLYKFPWKAVLLSKIVCFNLRLSNLPRIMWFRLHL